MSTVTDSAIRSGLSWISLQFFIAATMLERAGVPLTTGEAAVIPSRLLVRDEAVKCGVEKFIEIKDDDRFRDHR